MLKRFNFLRYTLLLLFIALTNTIQMRAEDVEFSAYRRRAAHDRIVNNVTIIGNNIVPINAIKLMVPFKQNYPLDIKQTTPFIKALHEKFNQIQKVRVETRLLPDNKIDIRIVITEKEPLDIVTIIGNTSIKEKDIRETMEVDDLQAINASELKLYSEKIREMYLDKGYFQVQIDASLAKRDDDKMEAIFTIIEGTKSIIKRISFSGNEYISSKELRGIVITSEDWLLGFLDKNSVYHPERLRADKYMVEQHYQNKGFLNAKVTDINIDVDEKSQNISLTFDINEGDLYTIGSISAPGNNVLPEEYLLMRIPVREGDTYSREKLTRAIKNLESIWGDYGYIFAHVNPSMQPNSQTKTIDLTFYSELGEPIILNRITIRGNKKTRDKIIRRKVTLQEGEIITKRGMELSKQYVTALGYFDPQDGVNWKLIKRTPTTADLDLIVKEGKTGNFNLQAGYGGAGSGKSSPESGFSTTLQFSETNLMGHGTHIDCSVSAAQNDKTAMLHVSQPWLFDKPMLGAFDLYHKRPSYNQLSLIQTRISDDKTSRSVHERLTGGALSLGFITNVNNSILYNMNVRLTVGGESVKYQGLPIADPIFIPQDRDVYQHVLDNEFKPGEYIWVGLNFEQDMRNHPVHTSQGHWWHLQSRVAIPTFNNCIGFYKVSFDGHWFTPLIGQNDLVFHLHGYAGIAAPLNDKAIPFGELFHIGGQSSVRGFNYGEIGPQFGNENSHDTIGGKKAFFVNVELLFPIRPDFSMKGAIFYDGGTGWDNPYVRSSDSDLILSNSFDYRHAVGFGIRVYQPMPVKIDWAFKIDPRTGESGHEVHFGSSYDW